MFKAMSLPNTNCPKVAWLVVCQVDLIAYPIADMTPANGYYAFFREMEIGI